LTYSIVGGNTGGAFAINAATGQITVANTTAVDFETNPTFTLTVRVADNGSPVLSALATVTVILNDVNDAPVLDNSGAMTLSDINQADANNSGTLVSAILASAGGNRITDQDAGAKRGIAVVAADTTYGTWQYSTDGGSTWLALGSVSNGSARLLAADANTRVRFVPASGYNGTVTNGITFRAWDRTTGTNGGLASTAASGGTTAFSTAVETASIHVRSPLEQVNLLSADVQNLVNTGVLTSSQADQLQSKLTSAKRKLEQGNMNAADNQLNSFINLVNNYVGSGLLTQAQGQNLITKANAAIASIDSHQLSVVTSLSPLPSVRTSTCAPRLPGVAR